MSIRDAACILLPRTSCSLSHSSCGAQRGQLPQAARPNQLSRTQACLVFRTSEKVGTVILHSENADLRRVGFCRSHNWERAYWGKPGFLWGYIFTASLTHLRTTWEPSVHKELSRSYSSVGILWWTVFIINRGDPAYCGHHHSLGQGSWTV